MYNFDELLENRGGVTALQMFIDNEGYGYKEALAYIGIVTTSKVTGKKLFTYCNRELKFPHSKAASRKWMLHWERDGNAYWFNNYLTSTLLSKLTNPIINKTSAGLKRGRISMWGHPRANSNSHQVSAHEVLWEMGNECYLPAGYEVFPLDGDFLNLVLSNFQVRTSTERKSLYATGERNFFYTGTQRYINYTRGWNRISKGKRLTNPTCEYCNNLSELSVNVHHIISYWLFSDNDVRVHSNENLISLCDSCHGNVHQNNINISPLLSVMRCNVLLELLESLKSQVSDSMMEIYIEVEKQLGLTDNQQRSS